MEGCYMYSNRSFIRFCDPCVSINVDHVIYIEDAEGEEKIVLGHSFNIQLVNGEILNFRYKDEGLKDYDDLMDRFHEILRGEG
jgi:hypothetical protein